VNIVDDPAVIGNPVLRKFAITSFEANSEGMTYRVMVRVHNREGFNDSPYFRIMNLGFPLPITSDIILLDKNETSVLVQMPLVADDNSVFSYELQIDNGQGG